MVFRRPSKSPESEKDVRSKLTGNYKRKETEKGRKEKRGKRRGSSSRNELGHGMSRSRRVRVAERTLAVLGWLFSIEYSFADHKRETNGEDKAFKTD